jgi:hypothetical protein
MGLDRANPRNMIGGHLGGPGIHDGHILPRPGLEAIDSSVGPKPARQVEIKHGLAVAVVDEKQRRLAPTFSDEHQGIAFTLATGPVLLACPETHASSLHSLFFLRILKLSGIHDHTRADRRINPHETAESRGNPATALLMATILDTELPSRRDPTGNIRALGRADDSRIARASIHVGSHTALRALP